MDTKEMNIAIYRAIASKANELFRRVKIDAGTYSAKELAERKRGKECLCLEMKEDYEEITISVESFVCRFIASMVFTVLAKFEKLVPVKERIKFTRCEESETICSLCISISKEAATVAKFADRQDGMREALKYVYLDAERGVLVATNGKRLAVRPVSISNIEGELPENGFYILPKFLKAGSYEIACIKKAGELCTLATNAAGETSLCPSEWRYPDYRRVIPEGGTAIRVLDVKTFSAFVKQAAKDKECKLRIEAKAGSGRISVSAVERWDEEKEFSKIEVELLSPAICTAVFGFEPTELLPALSGWTGELLIHERRTCARLGSSIGQTVVVHCETNGGYEPQISEEIVEPAKEEQRESLSEPTEKLAEPLRRISPAVEDKHSQKVLVQAKEFAHLITLLRRNVKNRDGNKTIRRNLNRFKALVHNEFFRSVTVLAYLPQNGYLDGTLTEFYRRCSLLEKFEKPREALGLFPESPGIPLIFEEIRMTKKQAKSPASNTHSSRQNRGYLRQNTGQKYWANGRGWTVIGQPPQISPAVSPNQRVCFSAFVERSQIVGTIRPKCYYNSS